MSTHAVCRGRQRGRRARSCWSSRRIGRRVPHAHAEHAPSSAQARRHARALTILAILGISSPRRAGKRASSALSEVALGESTRLGEHRLLLRLGVGSVASWRRAVDVVRPVFDLGGAGSALLVRLVGELANFPRDEPSEEDRHEEAKDDDSDDDDEGDVEDNVGSNAAERDRVDETDADGVDHALGDGALTAGDHELCDVATLERGVGRLDLVEDGGVRDLGLVEPVEEVEVEDGSVWGYMASASLLAVAPSQAKLTHQRLRGCETCS